MVAGRQRRAEVGAQVTAAMSSTSSRPTPGARRSGRANRPPDPSARSSRATTHPSASTARITKNARRPSAVVVSRTGSQNVRSTQSHRRVHSDGPAASGRAYWNAGSAWYRRTRSGAGRGVSVRVETGASSVSLSGRTGPTSSMTSTGGGGGGGGGGGAMGCASATPSATASRSASVGRASALDTRRDRAAVEDRGLSRGFEKREEEKR